MRNLLYICLVLLTFSSCSFINKTEINIIVSIPNIDNVTITSPSDYFDIKLDEFGMGSKTVEIDKACFVSLFCGGAGLDLYLSPNKDINIRIGQTDGKLNIEVDCDDEGINNYLIADMARKKNTSDIDNKLDELSYINKIEEKLNREISIADKLLFSDDFKTLNKERIRYDVLYSLSVYPQYHSFELNDTNYLPSQTYIDYVSKYFNQDKILMGLSNYVSYMDNVSVCVANRYIKDWDSKQFTTNAMTFILENVKNERLKETLITKRLNHYLTTNGLKNSQEFIDVFNKNVKYSVYKDQINILLERLESLEKGNRSFPFVFKDDKSRTVSLDGLKGKYLYMCVWASWCPSCKIDIVAFEKLRRKYANNNNIEFVSLSLDNDRNLWKRTLKEYNLDGLQLNYNGELKFLDAYMIFSIPRFILIDNSGYIIDARTLSAKDIEIEALLNSLLS